MKLPLSEKEFMEGWQRSSMNADHAFGALGEATLQAINHAYYAGIEDGRMRSIGVQAGIRIAPVQQADICRSAILDLIGSSNDSEYLQAVYSFAEAYPQKVTDEKSVSQEEKHIQEIVDILSEAGLKTQAEIYYFVREYCGVHNGGLEGMEPANKAQVMEKSELACRFAKKLMR